MKLLVFLPCLNEAENIGSVIKKIPRSLAGVSQVDILVVDDGSTDGTGAVAEQLGATVITHKENRGVGAAFQSAMKYFIFHGGDVLVNIDADGQFDPAEIPKMIEPIQKGQADYVIADRFYKGRPTNMPLVKYWGNHMMNAVVNNVTGKHFNDVSCGFRAFTKEAAYHLNLYGQFTYTQETITNLSFHGLKAVHVPIQVQYFPDRTSRVANNLFAYGFKTSKIILKSFRDHKPFFFFSAIATFFFLIGFLFLAFLFAWFFKTSQFGPYIWMGFTGAAFIFTSLILYTIALVADMIKRLRHNQDVILYLLKRSQK